MVSSASSSSSVSSLFHVQHDAAKGRCVVATKRLRRGTTLLVAPAFAAVSTTSCNACFATDATASLLRCSGCRLARYCSRQCQRRDWSDGMHALECVAWKSVPPHCRNTAAQTILLVLRLTARLWFRSPSSSSSSDHEDVLALRHHVEDHSTSQLREFEDMARLVLALLARSKFNAEGLDVSTLETRHLRDVVLLFCRVNCNAFSLCDDVNRATGLGVFPRAALLNHACAPTCVVSFEPSARARLQLIRDVDAGEELTISYVELLESTTRRRDALRRSYFFECHCDRCERAAVDPSDDQFLDGFACDNAACRDGVAVAASETSAVVCVRCGYETHSQVKLEALEERWRSLRQRVEEEDGDRWLRLTDAWTFATTTLRLHPRNTRLATLSREIGNFLIDHETHHPNEEAIEWLQRELQATQWVLPTLALPTRGLLHYQLATRYQKGVERQQQQQAIVHFRQALDMYVQPLLCLAGYKTNQLHSFAHTLSLSLSFE
ncbi:hypothetical protein PINS_up004476 [Pythium insidiosum]|nr:hypothetical protein PINS_up004476 [Pythium insidiosum]